MIKASLHIWQHASSAQLTKLIGVASVGILLSALAFEHIGGYKPCFLCYRQRWAYYAAIGLVPLALWAISQRPMSLGKFILFVLALAFAANMFYGGYHAGVEWGLWRGPESCSGNLSDDANGIDLIKRLESIKIVPCGIASWRMFGISFAGYNALFSAGLAIVSLISLRRLSPQT